MDEVIDDLISLESGFNDDGLDCMESNLMMQSNVSIMIHYNNNIMIYSIHYILYNCVLTAADNLLFYIVSVNAKC